MEESSTISSSVPAFDDFHDVNGFLSVFDQLEKAGIELRNKSFAAALTQYLETLSKKNGLNRDASKNLLHI